MPWPRPRASGDTQVLHDQVVAGSATATLVIEDFTATMQRRMDAVFGKSGDADDDMFVTNPADAYTAVVGDEIEKRVRRYTVSHIRLP